MNVWEDVPESAWRISVDIVVIYRAGDGTLQELDPSEAVLLKSIRDG